jgi:hypothetical protein
MKLEKVASVWKGGEVDAGGLGKALLEVSDSTQ